MAEKFTQGELIKKRVADELVRCDTHFDTDQLVAVLDILDKVGIPAMYEVLKDMIDSKDCDIDHHGYCQTHGWLQDGVCPHFRAKTVLAKIEGK